MGEIQNGEVIRVNHAGTYYEMVSPTLTEVKNSIIVYPNKKKEKKMKNVLKRIIILFIILTNFYCGSKIIKKIRISYVNFSITTFISVDCSKFENTFSKEIRNSTITDTKKLGNFIEILNNQKKPTDTLTPDVRAKIVIYYNNGKFDTLCVGRLRGELNGKLFSIDDSLIKFIEGNKND